MGSDDRLTYCQISNTSVDDRRAFAVSLTATRCGDGVCNDFGVFSVTYSNGDSNPEGASIVARVLTAELMQRFYHLTLDNQDDTDLPTINEVLENAMQLANASVLEQTPGSSVAVTSVVTMDNRLFLTSIGNGYAVLINDDGMQRLTSDNVNNGKASLLGESDKAPQADTIIKYLPPFSGILLSSMDVWESEKLEGILMKSTHPGYVCDELKKITPPEHRPEVASVMLRLGYLQQ